MITYSDGVLTIDERCDKVRVSMGNNTYHANVTGRTLLPTPYGDGTYTIQTYQRIEGIRYRPLKTIRKVVRNASDYLLHYNLYVPYTPGCGYAAQMCAEMETPLEVYQAVRRYVEKTVYYDYIKAAKINTSTEILPDPLSCWNAHKGICQDIASFLVGMLRACGVPARLCIGYADKKYHAWAEANIDGRLYRFDPDTNHKSVEVYKRERWY